MDVCIANTRIHVLNKTICTRAEGFNARRRSHTTNRKQLVFRGRQNGPRRRDKIIISHDYYYKSRDGSRLSSWTRDDGDDKLGTYVINNNNTYYVLAPNTPDRLVAPAAAIVVFKTHFPTQPRELVVVRVHGRPHSSAPSRRRRFGTIKQYYGPVLFVFIRGCVTGRSRHGRLGSPRTRIRTRTIVNHSILSARDGGGGGASIEKKKKKKHLKTGVASLVRTIRTRVRPRGPRMHGVFPRYTNIF